ncbi:MAG: hypothetical protein FD123_1983 [Bacteroidetes bacterium]|nr:MAG: hypothetical protein FD123_1983 [Bacteroidota bacterium]
MTGCIKFLGRLLYRKVFLYFGIDPVAVGSSSQRSALRWLPGFSRSIAVIQILLLPPADCRSVENYSDFKRSLFCNRYAEEF